MKLKYIATTALLSFSLSTYAEPTPIEICVKERADYKWRKAQKEDGLLASGADINQFFESETLPDGNFIIFNDGTDEDPAIKFLKLSRAITENYQEVENHDGSRWLIAKKISSQICR